MRFFIVLLLSLSLGCASMGMARKESICIPATPEEWQGFISIVNIAEAQREVGDPNHIHRATVWNAKILSNCFPSTVRIESGDDSVKEEEIPVEEDSSASAD